MDGDFRRATMIFVVNKSRQTIPNFVGKEVPFLFTLIAKVL